jgi:hypothetical protein
MNEKKSYVGYAPKKANVVKLTNYIQQGSNEATKQVKQIKKGNKKRF